MSALGHWARRLAALVEARTPHGGSSKVVQQRRPPDAYVRHAVAKIAHKRSGGRRINVDGAHAIARSQGVHGRGPKLPYYQDDKRHKQTDSGRRNILRHRRERDRFTKDAKYYRVVGKRRAEYEGPWQAKKEDHDMRQYTDRLREIVAETQSSQAGAALTRK